MAEIEDKVVSSILQKFNALPKKCKPRIFEDGSREWVPLAGIAVVDGEI